MITVGNVFKQTLRYSQEDVKSFADVTGDNNPIHLDEAYAANTVFKKPIMHGFLSGSIFSKIFGTQFPGEGTIYLKQSMEFKRPMFVDTDYEAVCTVLSTDPEKHTATVQTQIFDLSTQKVVLDGQATIMHKEKI